MESLRDTYVENTRNALLDSARSLFAARDYADISAEELVRAAGLTRGALYHHFNGKQGLFEAIFSELENEAAQRIVDAERPPLRVFFGERPLELAEADYAQRLATWREWQPVAVQAQG